MSAHQVRQIAAPEIGARVILAIDTALGTSVALGTGDRVVEAWSDDPRGHSEAIGSLIERVFTESDVDPSAVTHVVAGMGPGPFTGLRVGIAAAHAFALGRGLTVLPLVRKKKKRKKRQLYFSLTFNNLYCPLSSSFPSQDPAVQLIFLQAGDTLKPGSRPVSPLSTNSEKPRKVQKAQNRRKRHGQYQIHRTYHQ